MNITNEQRSLLEEYDISVGEELNTLLLDLDAKITEIGFDANYDLNSIGLKLQLLYDQLYNQN